MNNLNKFISRLLFSISLLSLGSCSTNEIDVFGGIYGVISDMETGEPVRGASVILSPGNVSSITGFDGSYDYKNLEAKQYKLQVQANGYATNTRQITVVPGSDVICDMALRPVQEMAGVRLSTNVLNFDTRYSVLTLDLTNTGTSGTVDWNISGIEAPWLKVSPANGSTDMGKSSSIKVSIDRNMISQSETSFFTVNAAGGSQSVMVMVDKGSAGGGGNNPDVNIDNGLYAYYTFEEGSTENTVDGAYDAVPVNSPEFTDSYDGSGALKFRIPENSSLSIPEAMIDKGIFTVSFWVKNIGEGHIFHAENKDPGIANNYVFGMNSGKLFFMVESPYYSSTIQSKYLFRHPDLDASQWTMITITLFSEYNSYFTERQHNIKLYINGKFTDQLNQKVTQKDPYNKCSKFIFAGALQYNGSDFMSFPGMTLDNLRIYNNRALSDDEIKQIYEYER